MPRNDKPSAVGRAALTLALLLGFYVLALSIAGFLAWWPFQVGSFPAKLGLGSLFVAGTIAWAILPRWDRFPVPGPRLMPAEQPRLFEQLRQVAHATGERMPDEVFLVMGWTAFVAQRGGVLGIGSKRVMGLGLPLLNSLTVDELRAVVAHEFGHFHGGDTKLTPWIYKTRCTIGRTISALKQNDGLFMHRPFLWYGTFYMRVTQSVSRAQELAADRLAAEVVGRGAIEEGLRKVHRFGPGFEHYFHSEFVPVVNAGRLPRLLDGFERYLSRPGWDAFLSRFGADDQPHVRKTDPYDSHPSLHDRLAALERVRATMRAVDSRPSIALLDDLSELERKLLQFDAEGQLDVTALRPIEWEHVYEEISVPSWKALCARHAQALHGLRVRDLSALARDPQPVHQKMQGVFALPLEARRRAAWQLLGCAFALALEHTHWSGRSFPGEPVTFRHGQLEVQPFVELEQMQGRLGYTRDWLATCEQLGIAELELDPAAWTTVER
jgi:heat shock protein HtpX